MIRPKRIDRRYVKRAKKIIAKEAKTPAEANELKEVCRAMGAYHFVRYKKGVAKDGVDFLDAKEHAGETWAYDKVKRRFTKIS